MHERGQKIGLKVPSKHTYLCHSIVQTLIRVLIRGIQDVHPNRILPPTKHLAPLVENVVLENENGAGSGGDGDSELLLTPLILRPRLPQKRGFAPNQRFIV